MYDIKNKKVTVDDIEGMVLGRGQYEKEEELFEEAEEDIDRYIQIREF